MSICESEQENVAYEFVFTFTTCPARFTWLACEMGANGRTTAILKSAASRICSQQHVVPFYNSHLAFSPDVSLESSDATTR